MAFLLGLSLATTGCTVPIPGIPAPLPGGPATIYPPGAKVPDLSGRPEQLTPEQRIAASQEVTDSWAPLRTGDPAADAKSLLDTIAKTPGFADAGLGGDGSVWARYADGRPTTWILAYNDKTDPSTEPSPGPSVLTPPAPKLAPVPEHPDAAIFDFPFMYSGDATTAVSSMLTKANYKPRIVANHVSDLQTQIKSLGVLLADTHGGVSKTIYGDPEYGLATAELWKAGPEHLPKFKLYGEGLLVPAVIFPPLGPATYYWAINTSFVKKYWTFTDNPLIFIGACGLYATSEGLHFVGALRSVSPGESATILGWDGSVLIAYNARTAKKFFARVLGDNSVDNEKIPRRPFTYKQVYDWMDAADEIQIASLAPTLTITYGPAGDGQLRPSIIKSTVIRPGKKSSVPHAGERYLEIAGSFGPDPGPENRSVKVGETTLEVYPDGWNETNIQAKLPQDPASPGSYGDVVVEVRGHPSNRAPLTQWTGYVSQVEVLTDTKKSGKVHIFCPVRVIADVHFFRGAPRADPMTMFAAAAETTGPCTYRIWGSWSYPGEKHSLSGSGQFTPEDNIVGGFESFTRTNRDVNAGNHGDKPISVGTILAWINPKAPGTHTISSSSGTTRKPIQGDFSALGAYWNDRTFTLDNNFAVPTRVRDCNWNEVHESCTETWNLTPTAPTPTKDTQG